LEEQVGDTGKVVNGHNGGASEAGQLPKSELNPLVNPVLGRNLGRWAQVYFTTTPEKREQAVLELLHELENEAPVDLTSSQPPPASESAPKRTLAVDSAAKKGKPGESITSCRSCGFQNPIANQFCGKCGLGLRNRGVGLSAEEKFTSVIPSFPESGQPRILEADDVQWLRDKSLTILQDCPSPGSRISKFLLVVLLIGLGVLAYLHWSEQPQHVQLPGPVNNAISARESSTPSAEPSHVGAESSSSSVAPEPKRAVQPASLAHRESGPNSSAPQTLSKNSDDPSGWVDAAGDSNAGTQELRLAQRFLEGKTGTRDTSEAAKLLWKAVGKQNANAAILLSDLYMRGDGVSKNCDQARLLLIAAAKRGGSQAGEQLRRLETSGCR
jgi:hypothetical protein